MLEYELQTWYSSHVMFYISTENFRGFRVDYGTSSTSFTGSCYQHSDQPVSTETEVYCSQPVHTQFVRVRLNIQNTALRLCEIEIYGGKYTLFQGFLPFGYMCYI